MNEQIAPAQGASGPKFAVTTHSRLKSPRFFLPMVCANMEIRQQLAATPGCFRFASVVTGPREFWTISLWRSRGEMLGFMAGGAHERLMWNISRWFDSFWLMRWAPTRDEAGNWDGLCLGEEGKVSPPLDPPLDERASAVLSSLPELLAAIGPSGAPSYESSPRVRKSKEQVGWASGGMLRLQVDGLDSLPGAWSAINSIRRHLEGDPGVLRFSYGAAGPTELLVFAIFEGEDAWRRFRDGKAVSRLVQRWPESLWVMRWTAEHEFGQWDRLRVRTLRRSREARTSAGVPR